MRILVLSYYYPPDIGPGSLRAKSIVDALIKEGPSDLKIDVITTMPNRYHSLNISALKKEFNSKININRINLPKHKNGIIDQSIAFILFSFGVRKIISKKKWDIVIATSSRLLTASLGSWIAKKNDSKLCLDIRDLFTDTIYSIFKKKIRILMPLLYILEKWTYRSADMITLASPAFTDHIKKVSPKKSTFICTHGIDELFLNTDFKIKKNKTSPLVLYSGNIGEGQGLHKILPKMADEFQDIQFKIIGDGSARKFLTNDRLLRSQKNIKILNPMSRDKLFNEYRKADILFLHLNDYEAFNKVLPSKIFEYAATGKPILAGVSGYASKFLREQVLGVQVFDPCDNVQMKFALQKLLSGPKFFDRKKFFKIYSRHNIMKKVAKNIFLM